MAGNELAASFNWTDDQLTYLSFSRNDKPIAFTEHEIDLTFKDPRQNGEIEKILLDPQYRPGNASNADFWVETTITSPVSNQKVSETALPLSPGGQIAEGLTAGAGQGRIKRSAR